MKGNGPHPARQMVAQHQRLKSTWRCVVARELDHTALVKWISSSARHGG